MEMSPLPFCLWWFQQVHSTTWGCSNKYEWYFHKKLAQTLHLINNIDPCTFGSVFMDMAPKPAKNYPLCPVTSAPIARHNFRKATWSKFTYLQTHIILIWPFFQREWSPFCFCSMLHRAAMHSIPRAWRNLFVPRRDRDEIYKAYKTSYGPSIAKQTTEMMKEVSNVDFYMDGLTSRCQLHQLSNGRWKDHTTDAKTVTWLVNGVINELINMIAQPPLATIISWQVSGNHWSFDTEFLKHISYKLTSIIKPSILLNRLRFCTGWTQQYQYLMTGTEISDSCDCCVQQTLPMIVGLFRPSAEGYSSTYVPVQRRALMQTFFVHWEMVGPV